MSHEPFAPNHGPSRHRAPSSATRQDLKGVPIAAENSGKRQRNDNPHEKHQEWQQQEAWTIAKFGAQQLQHSPQPLGRRDAWIHHTSRKDCLSLVHDQGSMDVFSAVPECCAGFLGSLGFGVFRCWGDASNKRAQTV